MPDKNDFKLQELSKVVSLKDFRTPDISKVIVTHHIHDLPLCTPGVHDPKANCPNNGVEVSCMKMIARVDPGGKLEYKAFCTHLSATA